MHTAPDHTWMGKVATIYSLQDMAELAARLGSIVSYDRRGNVAFLDNFEGGRLRCGSSTDGTGADVDLVGWEVHSGSWAVKLTGGSDDTKRALIYRRQGNLPTSRVGLEAAFYPGGNWAYLWMQFNHYDGLYEQALQVTLHDTDGKLYYTDTDGVNQELTDAPDWTTTYNFWHHMKLVVDLDDTTYVRWLIDDTEHDMSAYTGRKLANTLQPHLYWAIGVVSTAGENGVMYVDDVILTHNEP